MYLDWWLPDRSWKALFYPSALVVAGFAIRQVAGNYWWIYTLVMLPLDVIAIGYVAVLYLVISKGGTIKDETAPLNVPVKVNGYALVTDTVQINREQQVAHVLLQQKADGMKVDLTEAFWLKRGNFDGTREEWVDVMGRWTAVGALSRTGRGKSSGYTVSDWGRVRQYSRGRIPG